VGLDLLVCQWAIDYFNCRIILYPHTSPSSSFQSQTIQSQLRSSHFRLLRTPTTDSSPQPLLAISRSHAKRPLQWFWDVGLDLQICCWLCTD